jgi:hypothetical protein
LAAAPSQASSGLIKVTHADTPFRSKTAAQKPAASAPKTQPGAPEVQIAVMAKKTVPPGVRRNLFIHR